uniref:Uncharacterized protein n=1 Tax=Anopheles stephensi TaxID=30069 RepID=A0A182YR43_ANOST
MLLVVVDAYSKWLEVKVTSSTTTNATFNLLDELFASYVVPITVVSDNVPQFASPDFRSYLKNAGVKYHKLTAPCHPATNGQAARDTLQRNLNTFFSQFRKAPHLGTGDLPAKLFLGRNIRTRIDLVRPHDITDLTHVTETPVNIRIRTFFIGQKVYCLSGNLQKDKWIVGVIIARLGDLHYHIRAEGKTLKRYIDQIRLFYVSPQVLIPYDQALPLASTKHVSKTGIGDVLSHQLSNVTERPIVYASCTPSATEQRYLDMDKEALSIV